MTLNFSALFLSLFIHLFIGFLLLNSFSLSIKKREEVKITILESPPSLSEPQPELKSKELSAPGPPRELKPFSPTPSKTQQKIFQKAPVTQKSLLQTKPSEEAFLQERLSQLKAKDNQRSLQEKEEMEFLQNKLASLKNKINEKSTLKESFQDRPITSTTPSSKPLSQDYLLLVKRKLQTHFELPIYLKNKKDLSALVEIEVNHSGEITKITFLQRSPEPTFNQAVERCLKAVNPLPVNQKTSLKIEFRAEGVFKIN